MHVHLVGEDRDENGCYLHPRMEGRLSTRAVRSIVGARSTDAPADVDARCRDHLFHHLDGAPSIDLAVLLALDGVYDASGRLDEDRSSVVVPNDYAFAVAEQHPKLVVGCSINPLRPDAVDELERCAARGAVLVKWIPAAMGFDPADERCLPFYAAMKAHGLPLLSHVGTEFAVATVDASLGALRHLLAPLDAGVMVIVPHAGGRKLFRDEADWIALASLVRQRDNLVLDNSALALAHRRRRLLRLLETPDLYDSVLHGSDYPLPSQVWAFTDRIGLKEVRRIKGIESVFERDVELKRALGAPDSFLERAGEILPLSAS
jgi:predicted TIM-barrel fold metal-dependent hydrolase